MQYSSLAEQVKHRLGYLVNEYGFSVIHEESHVQNGGNAIVVLESPDYRIRVLREGEQIRIDVGPLCAPSDWSISAPDLWFGLTYVTGFLSNGIDQWEYDFPDTSLDYDSRVDRQLVRLAGILRPYCSQILRFFQPEAFERHKRELLDYQERQVEAWLRKYR
ncbi:MAG: hypothetical protein KBG20_09430 [Caldilineaceae bacterium]|nr:hypothetical protein [Caldilineaceae bacterium]MBP8121596.1 hypothetical protein [Caldilineaceae bacterium]MBP9072509.1 hypothetical protein [Caldilineaceae bacterium]